MVCFIPLTESGRGYPHTDNKTERLKVQIITGNSLRVNLVYFSTTDSPDIQEKQVFCYRAIILFNMFSLISW